MASFIVLLVALGALCGLCLGQPNCGLLNVPANLTSPMSGSNLRYCRTSAQQCCNNEYLTSEANTLRDHELVDGLHEQLLRTGGQLTAIGDGMLNYTRREFIPNFIRRLNFPLNFSLNTSTYNESLQNGFLLRRNDNFRPAEFTDSLFSSEIELIISRIILPSVVSNNGPPRLEAEQSDCVRNALRQYINQTTKGHIDESFEEYRRAVTSLNKIVLWYNHTFLPNLETYFTPLDACVNAFIRLQCQRCVQNIAPLCRGICSDVAYGCYGIIENGFRGQFNVLWNVTSQLMNISRASIANITKVAPRYLITSLNNSEIFRHAVDCGITIANPPTSNRKRRSTDDDDDDDDDNENNRLEVPGVFIQAANSLIGRGFVSYGNEGPLYCRNYTNSDCWNGTANVTTYSPPDVNITEISNPVSNPLLEGVTAAEVRSQVSALGNPVTDYISGDDFGSTAPQSLDNPEDTPTSPSGAGIMSSSVLLIFLAITYALLIFN